MSLPDKGASGRPRDEELTEQILDVALAEVQEHGFSAVRIERIAQRVGCGKTTIYRRWPDRGSLVAAAMHRAVVLDLPDTGSVAEDLFAHSGQNLRGQGPQSPTQNSYSALVSPEVRPYLWENGFLAERRSQGRRIIRRGVSRGELPENVDADAVLDALAGFVLYRRAVRVDDVTDASIRGLIHALVTAPPVQNTAPRSDEEEAHVDS